MSRYRTWQTQQGLALAASLLEIGGTVGTPFTRVEVGSGRFDPDESLEGVTQLKQVQASYPINAIRRLNDTHVLLEVVITNAPPYGPTDLPYDIGEIGIYANNPEGEEILYALVLPEAGTRLDQMTPYDGKETCELRLELKVVVARAEAAFILAGSGAFALYDDFEALRKFVGSMSLAGETTIPARCWVSGTDGASVRIPVPAVSDEYIPQVIVTDEGAADAVEAGMELVCEAVDGAVIVYADSAPGEDIGVSLSLTRRTQALEIEWPEEENT